MMLSTPKPICWRPQAWNCCTISMKSKNKNQITKSFNNCKLWEATIQDWENSITKQSKKSNKSKDVGEAGGRGGGGTDTYILDCS